MEVWSPVRPHIGVQAVQRILMRHVSIICPESELWTAVIAQAINDTLNANDLQRQRARRFLTRSQYLDFWCHLIGIEIDFVREVATKAGYLVDEDALWKPVKSAARRSRRQTPKVQEAVHAGL